MASEARINIGYRVAGVAIDAIVNRQDEEASSLKIALESGKAGTLTTRTTASSGVITVAEGHNITDANTVTVFFPGGIVRSMTVSSTTGTTITVTGGDGDDFPAEDSAVVIAKDAVSSFAFAGNDINLLVFHATGQLSVDVVDSLSASELLLNIPAGESWAWIKDFSGTNPLAGKTLATVTLANGSTTSMTATVLRLLNTL